MSDGDGPWVVDPPPAGTWGDPGETTEIQDFEGGSSEQEERERRKTQQQKEQLKQRNDTCLNRAITAWGWFFDISTNVISLVDVVSDILVAVQFYQMGEMTWFWLVLSSLMLSSIVYMIFMVELPFSTEKNFFHGVCCIGTFSQFPRPIKYPMVLCVAQLAPTFYWLLQQVAPRRIVVSTFEAKRVEQQWENKMNKTGNKALEEEEAAIHGSTEVMGRLEMALLEHLETHLLFYIETIVESIPQSIIQLLAVTFLGQATSLQVFSMSLSLISIVSKAYTLSFAVELKMCLYKFLIAAHDIFSLFYVFSTLLGKEEPDEILLFDFFFSYLSYIWIIKEFVVCSYITLMLMGAGIGVWIEQFCAYHYRRCTARRLCEMFGLSLLMILAYILLCIPVALAVEGTKLLWLSALMARVEPHRQNFPEAAAWLSFVERGDYNERLRFLMLRWANTVNEEDVKYYRRERRKAIRTNDKSFAFTPGLHRSRIHNVVDVCETKPLVPNNFFWYNYEVGNIIQACKTSRAFERCIGGLWVVFLVIYTTSQLFSLAFPFISFILRYETQNLLQRFCFYALAAPLLLLLLMAPWFWSYFKFLCQTRVVWERSSYRINVAAPAILAYHEPPHAIIVRRCIPTSLIPYDLVNHTNKFLSPSDVDISQLTIAECQQLKDEFRMDEGDNVGPEGLPRGLGTDSDDEDEINAEAAGEEEDQDTDEDEVAIVLADEHSQALSVSAVSVAPMAGGGPATAGGGTTEDEEMREVRTFSRVDQEDEE